MKKLSDVELETKLEDQKENRQANDQVTESTFKTPNPPERSPGDRTKNPPRQTVELLNYELASTDELTKMKKVYEKRTGNGDFLTGFHEGRQYYLSVLDRLMFLLNLMCGENAFCVGPESSFKIFEATRLNSDVLRHVNTHKKFSKMVMCWFKSNSNDTNGKLTRIVSIFNFLLKKISNCTVMVEGISFLLFLTDRQNRS